jgi:hypothetical protein
MAARIENLSGMDGCEGCHAMGSLREEGTRASLPQYNRWMRKSETYHRAVIGEQA